MSEPKKQITIEWGGKEYGPYATPEDALKDGFHLPPDVVPANGAAATGAASTPHQDPIGTADSRGMIQPPAIQ